MCFTQVFYVNRWTSPKYRTTTKQYNLACNVLTSCNKPVKLAACGAFRCVTACQLKLTLCGCSLCRIRFGICSRIVYPSLSYLRWAGRVNRVLPARWPDWNGKRSKTIFGKKSPQIWINLDRASSEANWSHRKWRIWSTKMANNQPFHYINKLPYFKEIYAKSKLWLKAYSYPRKGHWTWSTKMAAMSFKIWSLKLGLFISVEESQIHEAPCELRNIVYCKFFYSILFLCRPRLQRLPHWTQAYVVWLLTLCGHLS